MGRSDEPVEELLALLRPAPARWVAAAKSIPRLEAALAEVLARSQADEGFRRALAQDPHAALAGAGLELEPEVVAHLMRRRDGAS